MAELAGRTRWRVVLLVIVGFVLFSPLTWAQPRDNSAPTDAAAGPDATALEEAKRLFRKGNELRKTGNFQRALEFYVMSRRRVPSAANTLNAAVCLRELGRLDEALEMHEQVIAEFSDKLTAGERTLISKQTSQLRRKLGSINVVANVKGSLVIDGRPRGELPLLSPVRVLPGARTLMIVKDGYGNFEKTVEVEAGTTTTVQAKLKPLVVAGHLRVEALDHDGADLFIDGARVGSLPWEGALEPGEHVYYVRKGEVGTAPHKIFVVKGQLSLARAKPSPLGLETRISVKPPEATLYIGDVPLGRGRWEGRLPVGKHAIVAREQGYQDESRTLVVDTDRSAQVELVLTVDATHPRWGVDKPGLYLLDIFGGIGLAPSLGSDAESKCSGASCSNPLALGLLVGGRGGYEFPIGLSLHLVGGYLRLTKTIERSLADDFVAADTTVVPTLYQLTDRLQLSGGLVGAGVGYRNVVAEPLELRANVALGALFAFTSDKVEGTVTAGQRTLPVSVQQSGETVNDVGLFVMPQLQAGLRFGGFGVGLGLTAAVVVSKGPEHALGEVRVESDTACDLGDPTDPACAPREDLIAGERAYDTFVMLVPQISASYAF